MNIKMRVDSIMKMKSGYQMTFRKDNGAKDSDSVLFLNEVGMPLLDIDDEVTVTIEVGKRGKN